MALTQGLQEQLNEQLLRASWDGDLDKVKDLIKQGADVHYKNDIAAEKASISGHLEVLKYLNENGADILASNDYVLRRAAYYKHLEIIKYLHQQGADFDSAIESADDSIKEELTSYKEKILLENDLKNVVTIKKTSSPFKT